MKITHPIYQSYPEAPYISPQRDLKMWELRPETFPYSKVALKQMIRVEEGILPGDLVMLWRISFNNFTTESHFPDYFEYRYGVDANQSILDLMNHHMIELCDAKGSISAINMIVLKRILGNYQLPKSGKRADLEKRVLDNLGERELAQEFDVRRYQITDWGSEVLKNHDAIIQEHGPKM